VAEDSFHLVFTDSAWSFLAHEYKSPTTEISILLLTETVLPDGLLLKKSASQITVLTQVEPEVPHLVLLELLSEYIKGRNARDILFVHQRRWKVDGEIH
jgi:hypothetical protein